MRDFQLPGRSPVVACNGLCATSHPLAAQTAISLLQAGGNAMDAAIGAAVLLGICEPQMTGIGGDAFVLFTVPGETQVRAMNGSGRAPRGLDAADLRAKGLSAMPKGTADAVTVPAAVDAFCRLSQDWGRISLDQVLAPAIRYADEGVPVAARTAFDWAIAIELLQGVAREKYLLGGNAPREGQIFRSPEQAEVLRRIAKNGRDAFYSGEVAEDMVEALRAAGGCHTLDDFAETAADYTDPVAGRYKGLDLIEHPPNGQGATAILMNNILSHFDLPSMKPFGAARIHIEAEAAKLAYDARNRFIADPNQALRMDHMLAPETAAALAALINPKRAMPAAAALTESVHKDTVYLSIVDRDRMAVSLIYSIYRSFGTGIASPKFGVLFQNRGTGFTLEEGHPNEAKGGKRPMHTIIPGMMRKPGSFLMPFGVMGGAYQPCGHSRVLTNMADYGLDPQSAIDAPRSFADKGELNLERGVKANVRSKLADMGHRIVTPEKPLGGAQAVLINEAAGTLHGASDPRKDGAALGY